MSDQPYLIVSAATPKYVDLLEGLEADCARLGLESYTARVPDQGSWVLNCALKPMVLASALAMSRGRAVVWVDADANIVSEPVLFAELARERVDFAAHRFQWSPKHPVELLSGTVFFGATAGGLQVLRDWGALCSRIPQDSPGQRPDWDQNLLMQVVDDGREIEARELPGAYCSIAGDVAERIQLAEGERAVIVHNQASRTRRT